MNLRVCCISPDLRCLSAKGLEAQISEYLDHDIIVFPEYLGELCHVAPKPYPGKVLVYGSRQVGGTNRLACAAEGRVLHTFKIKLTPWEKKLKQGQDILTFDFRGVTIAILICFDIEFPELAVALKQTGVELLIVPSATETDQGYYRVSRCASARAVELGCAVVTCHLIGETDLELLDVNVGANNMFLPAQSGFDISRISPPVCRGPVISSFTVPVKRLREQKLRLGETNPAIH